MAKIVITSVYGVGKWDWRRLAVLICLFFLPGAGWVARSLQRI